MRGRRLWCLHYHGVQVLTKAQMYQVRQLQYSYGRQENKTVMGQIIHSSPIPCLTAWNELPRFWLPPAQIQFCEPLNMWPVTSHVYKRATEPGHPASRICTQPNGRNYKILYFMEIALSNSYQLLIWWKGAHLKTCLAFTFISSHGLLLLCFQT